MTNEGPVGIYRCYTVDGALETFKDIVVGTKIHVVYRAIRLVKYFGRYWELKCIVRYRKQLGSAKMERNFPGAFDHQEPWVHMLAVDSGLEIDSVVLGDVLVYWVRHTFESLPRSEMKEKSDTNSKQHHNPPGRSDRTEGCRTKRH